MSTENNSTFNPKDEQQYKSADSQGGASCAASNSEEQNEDKMDTDKKVERVEDLDGELSVDDIIALEISRNRDTLRRTASQRAKAGLPITGHQSQSKGTPVLEKSQGLTEAHMHQLIHVGVSILFLVIVVIFAWYVLLPEVENSPATPYQGMKQEARIEKYRKKFGFSPDEEEAAQDQSEQDLFDKSMTLGQNESDVFQRNSVFSKPVVNEAAGTSSNGLVVIPSEEEFENMTVSQKRQFVRGVLMQMEAQVEDIHGRAHIKYASMGSSSKRPQVDGVATDTVNASFNSWADEGKGSYKDLLHLLEQKHQRLEAMKKLPSLQKVAGKEAKYTVGNKLSNEEQSVAEEFKSTNNQKNSTTDSVVLITLEGATEKVCADSIKRKSVEAEKVLVSAIAHEIKNVKMNTPVVSGEIPEKYAKNIEGLLTTHVVSSGETLSSLSRLYYNHIKYASYIYAFNREKITDKDMLPLGVELDIPKIKGVSVDGVDKRNK